MAHKRIRPFNTKDTYPEQKLDNDLAQAVVARGTMVFLRGQVGQDLDTRESVGIGDPVAQTHKTMQNIKMLLEESGSRMDHICRIVVYLTDIRYRDQVYRTMGQYMKGVHAVSTGIVVPALARPEWVVEIEATAVIPD
jgi:enamine deaminase RidA (YjgF/YER057c/UK114 family)